MPKNDFRIDIVDEDKVLHFRNLTKEQLVFLAKVQGLMEFKEHNNKKNVDLTYEQFTDAAFKYILQNATVMRTGQALMNYLHEVWPEEYKRVSSVDYYSRTDIDCFYNTALVPNTLEHIRQQWKNYPN